MYDDLAKRVVPHFGLSCEIGENKTVHVKVYEIKIENGQMCRIFKKEYDWFLPEKEMTASEFLEEKKKLMKLINPEFHEFIEELTEDSGGSYETELSSVRNLVGRFQIACERYRRKM